MNTPKRLAAGLIACAFLATGCLTPIKLSQSNPVSPRGLSPEFAEYRHPSEDKGKVVIVRDSRFVSRFVSVPLSVNDRKIALIGNGESLIFYLPEGTHFLSVDVPLDGKLAREKGIRVVRGKEHFYRLSVSSFGEGGWHLEKSSRKDIMGK